VRRAGDVGYALKQHGVWWGARISKPDGEGDNVRIVGVRNRSSAVGRANERISRHVFYIGFTQADVLVGRRATHAQ
jgi:hypothetical protein